MQASSETFIDDVMANPINAELLDRLSRVGLAQCYLTAGCLFQAAWNCIAEHPAGWGVKDYDVFYFDDDDLSWEAEDTVIRRVRELTADLAVNVEVKNQARVHLWYPQRFRRAIPAVDVQPGWDRSLSGHLHLYWDRAATGDLYAPNGLADVYDGILRMNPVNSQPVQFLRKAHSYHSRWPWLRIVSTT